MMITRGLDRRRVARDLAPAVAVGLAAAAGMWRTSSWQAHPARAADQIGYLLVGVGAAALVLRRRRPAASLAVATAAATTALLLHYPYGPPFLAVGTAMFFVAGNNGWRRAVALCAAACAVLVAGVVVAADYAGPARPQVMVGGAIGWSVLPCLIGVVLRVRREDLAQFRDEQVRRSAYAERLRIAREIHETAGQGLAAINIQSAAALRLTADDPRGALEILRTINRTSKDTLGELRATLRTLEHGAEHEVPRRPLPGLSSLPSLISTMSTGGLHVELTETGERGELSVAVDLAAFRIVQQALAHVLRHASGTVATVAVDYRDDELALEITDNRDGDALERTSSQDMTGISEHAAAVGGTVRAGERPDGRGFRVSVRLSRR
ncbi:histidine kinase [Streptomyces sp. NPDC052051]|uniref:sensor histidine kinase n=1 Tax=Streptomyces sp. NPDC052051 TaxID=3154649 RepID=UPI003417544A